MDDYDIVAEESVKAPSCSEHFGKACAATTPIEKSSGTFLDMMKERGLQPVTGDLARQSPDAIKMDMANFVPITGRRG